MRSALESVHLVAATIGVISFAALWVGTLWGSVLRSGWASSRLRHSTVHGIHMHLILVGLTLGVVHGVVQLAAPGGKVRVIDVVIPFTDRADPIGVGFGVLAIELMLATALSVLVQRKLGWHRWRALHSLGYLAFTLVAAHLLISGSEVAAAPVRAAVALAWAAVAVTGASTIAPVARLPRTLLERVARRHRAEEITVAVDAGRCASFGFCEQEAPAIFTLRSDRRLAYRSVVSSDQAEAATRAAVVCPARAITLGRLPTAVVLAQPVDEPVIAEPGIAEPAGGVPVAASLAPIFQPASAGSARKAGSARRPAGPDPRRPAPVRGPAARAPEALPPPSELQDTGRHHLPPLRGLPGGRSGSGR